MLTHGRRFGCILAWARCVCAGLGRGGRLRHMLTRGFDRNRE
jgi:hypothetical protein